MGHKPHYHICGGALIIVWDNGQWKFHDPDDKNLVYPLDDCPHCGHTLFQTDVGTLITEHEPSHGFSPELMKKLINL